MIRVGFEVHPSGGGWTGGVNYYRNLFRALTAEPRLLTPVALVDDPENIPKELPTLETVKSRLVRFRSSAWYLRMIVRKVLRRDWLREHTLRSGSIDVLSHSGWLGKSSRVPSVAWIPDFQHVHLPEFFSEKEIRIRDRSFRQTIENATLVVVSSEMARSDLASFSPDGAHKARVLRFADCSAWDSSAVSPQQLQKKYSLPEKYFLLPNQFWAHKNHRIVIDALSHLREQGKRLVVVATGNTKDYRRPGHYSALMERCRDKGVEAEFVPLGMVPYEDLAGMMRTAVAIINPSLFEGWSTTVEEARSLGKRTVLSSIPVHLEQSPPRAAFFDPHDSEELAQRLWTVWEEFSFKSEEQCLQAAIMEGPERKLKFAQSFHQIVLDAQRLGSR